MNEGVCVQDCDNETPYKCQCPEGWEGKSCNLKVSFFPSPDFMLGSLVIITVLLVLVK